MEPTILPQTNNVAPATKRKHRVLLIGLAVVFVTLYITGNIWFYFYVTGKIFTNTGSTRKTKQGIGNQTTTTSSAGGNSFQETAPTPTPTPRPTGPGSYACDPVGQCKLYSDAVRKEKCTVTYADLLCLDRCGDTAKRCKP